MSERTNPPSPSSSPETADGDYEVGYKRPPAHSQFRKGQSGNPKGRPKGAKSFRTLAREALNEPVRVTENGRVRTLTKAAIGIKKVANHFAQTGDIKALQALARLYGEEAQNSEGSLVQADRDTATPQESLTGTEAGILEWFLSRARGSEANDKDALDGADRVSAKRVPR